ncbi:DUF2125 domain-containing protein [Thioclava sp. A2]|uniref:DUF2125 domain-containing protein n=1 Tax=Thioclava sp. FCG-A2 TaxID=3080562 RepID=UPI002952E78D|nr:DUF2125 domain-containing protein [Thioclava sp. A2]MDV7271291.1 DUF2125 domain-containing protein [Thioclava sp. A2]
MRKLIVLVAGLAGLYAGYWTLGAVVLRQGSEAALAQARADGWADTEEISLAGFPSRFDLSFSAPHLRSPDGQVEWSAPVAQALALSYQPNAVILWAAPEQELRVGRQKFVLKNDDMRASVRAGLTPDLPLALASLVVKEPRITPDGMGAAAKATELRASIAALEGGTAPSYRIGFEMTGLALPPEISAEAVGRVFLDGVAQFAAPLDRHLTAAPRPLALDISSAQLLWGDRRLDAEGRLTLAADGIPEGTINLKLGNWRDWLAKAEALGLLDPRRKPMLESIGQMMAQQSADGTVPLPLVFARGQIRLGPIPLGPAPRLF